MPPKTQKYFLCDPSQPPPKDRRPVQVSELHRPEIGAGRVRRHLHRSLSRVPVLPWTARHLECRGSTQGSMAATGVACQNQNAETPTALNHLVITIHRCVKKRSSDPLILKDICFLLLSVGHRGDPVGRGGGVLDIIQDQGLSHTWWE